MLQGPVSLKFYAIVVLAGLPGMAIAARGKSHNKRHCTLRLEIQCSSSHTSTTVAHMMPEV